MNSIDRKLARCQHEIEAAKPKGLSLDDFRFLKHSIRGTAPESKSAYAGTLSRPASTDAAPPSHVFKVGGKFRVKDAFAYLFPINEFIVTRVNDEGAWAIDPNDKSKAFFYFSNIELIPEPKAEDGWIEWNGGECPVAPETLVVVKNKYGHIIITEPRKADILVWDGPSQLTAYCVVKP